jgi:hypothetical protein
MTATERMKQLTAALTAAIKRELSFATFRIGFHIARPPAAWDELTTTNLDVFELPAQMSLLIWYLLTPTRAASCAGVSTRSSHGPRISPGLPPLLTINSYGPFLCPSLTQ